MISQRFQDITVEVGGIFLEKTQTSLEKSPRRGLQELEDQAQGLGQRLPPWWGFMAGTPWAPKPGGASVWAWAGAEEQRIPLQSCSF